MNDTLKTKKKPGRPSTGPQPMTDAERKRNSRDRLAAAGREVSVRLSPSSISFVDQIAMHVGETRSNVLEHLVDVLIPRFVQEIKYAGALHSAGQLDEASEHIRRYLMNESKAEDIKVAKTPAAA